MAWDGERIQAAVSTLTEALGLICDVDVEFCPRRKKTGTFLYGFPVEEIVSGTEKTIITITPKE